MTRVTTLVVLALFAGCATPTAPDGTSASASALAPDVDALAPGVHSFEIDVNGTPAAGLLAVPREPSDQLVVFCHGAGGTAEGWSEELWALSNASVWGIAMEYRGDPEEPYRLMAGIEDTVAATLWLRAERAEIVIAHAYGESMGGAVCAMSVARTPPGTFAFLFSAVGVVDVAASWEWGRVRALAELSPIGVLPASPNRGIEHETGGTPSEVPEEYRARSPIAHVDAIAAHGLARAYMVYGAADFSVPLEHGERFFDALTDASVPTSFYVVTSQTQSGVCGPPTGEPCPVGPAGHGAGRHMPIFLQHRLDGLGDPNGPATRGSIEGVSGRYHPPDTEGGTPS